MAQVRIIAEFRTQTSLSEGCNVILRHDCLVLAQVSKAKYLCAPNVSSHLPYVLHHQYH